MGKFALMGMQPRLTISVSNFVAQMHCGYDTSNPNGLAIWVLEALLPAGVIQLLNKGKEKRKHTTGSQKTSPNKPGTGVSIGGKGKGRDTAGSVEVDVNVDAGGLILDPASDGLRRQRRTVIDRSCFNNG